MSPLKILGLSASIAVAGFASGAAADELATVQIFYDFLSNPGSESHAEAFLETLSPEWQSIGDYSGTNKSAQELVGQLGFFDQLIPDLDWSVEAMHLAGDVVTVRSRATGTPVGPLFGVDGQGRSFEILTIDIHELEDGLIVRTYHVEDWAGALQQLSGS